MKRFLKIFGISLASLIGLVLIVAAVVVYVVFTPSRLTPIVKDVAKEFISTEHQIGEVDLTFFSTFPEFGLRANQLLILNPMEGAQSDTLLYAPNVVARINLTKFLNDKDLEIYELTLEDVSANIFMGKDGQNNFDVLVLPTDTTEDDTTAFSLPFNNLTVEKVYLKSSNLSFVQESSEIKAQISDAEIEASANNLDDINLTLDAPQVSATIGEEQYANNLHLRLKSEHTGLRLDTLSFTLPDAQLSVEQFDIALQGEATISDDITLNAHIDAKDWDIPQLLQLLPQSINKMLDGIVIDAATATLHAEVNGIYNDSLMPLVDAQLALRNAKASYMEVFPYQLNDINLDADAHIDLNNSLLSNANIHKLHARTGKTEVDANGKVSELLDDLLADLNIKLKVNLPEFKRYLESDGIATDLQGTATGKAHAKVRLSQLEKMNLKKADISGDLNIQNLKLTYDSMLVDSKALSLSFQIPNRKPTNKSADWIDAHINLPQGLDFTMIDFLKAQLQKSDLRLEASDILSSSPIIYANIDVDSENLTADMDTIAAQIKQPKLQAFAEYNTKAENAVPKVDAKLKFNDLVANYTDIDAHLTQSDLTAKLRENPKFKGEMSIEANLNTASLNANVPQTAKAQTGQLSLKAKAAHNPNKTDNILLEWNPELSFDLVKGKAQLDALPEVVDIPKIKFDYSNKVFDIADSRIILGNSDFSLSGKVQNIGNWLDKKGNLEGVLNFRSEHTDVNELMDMFSADEGTEEVASNDQQLTTNDQQPTADSDPFLVPKDIDLTLNTDIQEAAIFDQLARNLGGRLYVRNGVLVLEEMGFICNAAKLQLTAIYKTPRRDHLFVGLDYHMLDIDLQELVNMIPQIDTMMPMLRSFRGNAEFHIAAETFLDHNYDMKMSTARGAMSIEGKDLVLLDNETFGQIAKILMFKKKTENLVDSISAQATLYKNEIDIYPFCLSIDNYMAAVGGRHNMDMSFDYHVSLLKPLYIGVDVKGTFDDLKIRPAKCKYAQDFRPIIRRDVETQNASLKRMISESLKKNVNK